MIISKSHVFSSDGGGSKIEPEAHTIKKEKLVEEVKNEEGEEEEEEVRVVEEVGGDKSKKKKKKKRKKETQSESEVMQSFFTLTLFPLSSGYVYRVK